MLDARLPSSTYFQLLNMLKTTESHFKGEKAHVLLIDKIFVKKKDKKDSKKKMNSKASISKKKAKNVSAKDTCFHCGKDGHWKRNHIIYIASLKQK